VKFSRYLSLFWRHFFHIYHSFGVIISKFSHRIGSNVPKISLFWRQQFQKSHYFGVSSIGAKNILLSGYAQKWIKTFCQIMTYQNE